MFLILFLMACASKQQPFLCREIREKSFTTSIDEKLGGTSLLDSINTALKYNRLDYALNLIYQAEIKNNELKEFPVLKGEIFERRNQLDSASYYFTKALQAAEAQGDTTDILNLRSRLGLVHYNMNDYPSAAAYFKAGNKNHSNQIFGDFLKSFEDRKPFQIQSQTNSTTIDLVDLEPFPKLEVRVNGISSDDFILDTGCNMVVLSSKLAKKCGITPFQSFSSNNDGKTQYAEYKAIKAQYAFIDSLTLGDFKIYNVPAAILDEKHSSLKILGITLYKIEGGIGIPLMKKFKTVVNYPDKKITFSLPQNKRTNSLTPNMTISAQNVPYIQVNINELSDLNFLLDSGTEFSAIVQNSMAFLDSTNFNYTKSRRKIRDHVGIKIKLKNDIIPKKLVVDKYNIENFKLELLPEWKNNNIITQGVIGKDILKNYTVTFDFQNMRLDLMMKDILSE